MNFLLLMVTIYGFYAADFRLVFWLAFLAGLLTDLGLGRLVGIGPLVFLLTALMIFLYQKKFASTHLFFQLIFVNLIELSSTFLSQRQLSTLDLLTVNLLVTAVWGLRKRFKASTAQLELEI